MCWKGHTRSNNGGGPTERGRSLRSTPPGRRRLPGAVTLDSRGPRRGHPPQSTRRPAMQALYGAISCSVERMSERLRSLSGAALLGSLVLTASSASVHALLITPTFDSTITSAGNATDVENAINAAITTIDGLYSNSITVS